MSSSEENKDLITCKVRIYDRKSVSGSGGVTEIKQNRIETNGQLQDFSEADFYIEGRRAQRQARTGV